MKDRYLLRCAVFLLLTKEENNQEYILLQRRYQTGLLDGQYDVSSSGHLEQNETLADAMIRETKEEIGIEIESKDLNYSSTIHANFGSYEYLFIVFSASKFKGIPKVMEENKCDDISWYPINNLPDNIIESRKIMIDNYLNKNIYSEYGFKK